MLTTFEPHMHASGVRMCMEAIWGGRTETLSCSGYDHNWVRVYKFADDAAPLLPKGTLLHLIAYFDTTPANKNVVDPRNWQGLGHRSIDNMALTITPVIVLNDKEFQEEIAKRRQKLNLAKGQTVLGCPLCGFDQVPPMLTRPATASRSAAMSVHDGRGAGRGNPVAAAGRRAGACARPERRAGVRRVLAERRRHVRSACSATTTATGRRRSTCPSDPGTRSNRAVPTRDSPRTSSRVEISSSSRFACRRTSATRKSSGR